MKLSFQAREINDALDIVKALKPGAAPLIQEFEDSATLTKWSTEMQIKKGTKVVTLALEMTP